MIKHGEREFSIRKTGFIRSAIKGYSGWISIFQEMVQNSDDALGGNYPDSQKYMEVFFLPDKIMVKNGSLFSDQDFSNITEIASGRKREIADNTGSFGIGFVSVYQITDKPVIYSAASTVTLDPKKSTVILEESSVAENHTEFHLPLRIKSTEFGREIEGGIVTEEKVDEFKKELAEKLPEIIIFLRNLRRITLYEGHEVFLEVKKEERILNKECSKVIITFRYKNDISSQEWILFTGEFVKKNFMVNKQSVIRLAFDFSEPVRGILYNFLPTAVKTGLPFHINGDFFPTFDRKSINMDDADEALWNKKLMEEMGKLFVDKIEEIKNFLKEPEDFYKYLPLNPSSEPASLRKISDILIEKSGYLSLVLSEGHEKSWRKPSEIYRADEEITDILSGHVNFVSKEIARKYSSFLDKINTGFFGANDLVKYICKNVSEGKIEDAPDFINTRENLFRILKYLDNNLSSLLPSLSPPVFLDHRGYLRKRDGNKPVMGMVKYNRHSIFNILKDYFNFLDRELEEKFPALLKHFYVSSFGLNELLVFLTKICCENINLEEAHPVLNSHFKLKSIYEFIRRNYDVTKKSYILGLPIFLTQKGILKAYATSRTGFYLPCKDISDDLLTDSIISEQVLTEEIKDFFRDLLGIKELTFLNYLKGYVVKNYMSLSLDDNRRFNILKNIAVRYNGLNENFMREEIVNILKNTPLIRCNDGIYRKASHVYFPSSLLDRLFSSGYGVPENSIYPMEKEYKKSFWYQLFVNLGVRTVPSEKDIISEIERLIRNNDARTPGGIKEIYSYLNENWKDFCDKSLFFPLKTMKWLPDDTPESLFHRPRDLYPLRVKELVESQGKFLRFTPEPRIEFRDFLGIPGDVRTEDLVNHIIWLSENKRPLKNSIYVKLFQRRNDLELQHLKNKPVIWLGGNYWYPEKVFISNCYEDFGKYRVYLKGSNLENMYELFNFIGVREKPDRPEDYIELLREISSDFEESKRNSLTKEDRRLLNNAYEKLSLMNISRKTLEVLKGKKVVLNDLKALSSPGEVFIADKSSLLNKFNTEKDKIRTVRINSEESLNFIKKLGVREISRAVARELVENTGYTIERELTKRLLLLEIPVMRIRRTLERNIPGLYGNTDILKSLKVQRSGKILVSYSLSLPGGRICSPLYEEGSYYDRKSKTIYINGKGNTLLHLKKEIEKIIFPSLDIPNIIPLEIFCAPPSEISCIMDDMDYLSIVEKEEKFQSLLPVEKEEKFMKECKEMEDDPQKHKKTAVKEIEKSEAHKEEQEKPAPLFNKPSNFTSPKKRTDYPALVRDLGLKEWEVKKETAFQENRESKEEKKEEQRPGAVKFVVTFLNRIEGYLRLDSRSEKIFPEDKKSVSLRTDGGIEFPLYIDREKKIIYNREILRDFFVSEDIPAGGIVYIEHLNSVDKYRIYYLKKPAVYKAVKLVSAEDDGRITFEYVDMKVDCETSGQVFVAEKRHEDRVALFLEAEGKKSVFETIIKVFEINGGGILHQDEIFEKVYGIRMVSQGSVLSELQSRPCFVRAGEKRWKYEPLKGLRFKHSEEANKKCDIIEKENPMDFLDSAFESLLTIFSGSTEKEILEMRKIFDLIREKIEKLIQTGRGCPV